MTFVGKTYGSTYHDGTQVVHPPRHGANHGRGTISVKLTAGKWLAISTHSGVVLRIQECFWGIAKRHRSNFIQAANARASQDETGPWLAAQVDLIGTREDEIPTPHESHESVDHRLQCITGCWWSPSATNCWHQQLRLPSPQRVNCCFPLSHYTYDDSQEPSQQSLALGFHFCIKSYIELQHWPRSKRSRQSLSPPFKSSGSHLSNSRARPRATRRTAESSTSAPLQDRRSRVPSESHLVDTYGRGKAYFRNTEGHEVKTELKDWMGQTVDGTQHLYWQNPKSRQTSWATELLTEAKKRAGQHWLWVGMRLADYLDVAAVEPDLAVLRHNMTNHIVRLGCSPIAGKAF